MKHLKLISLLLGTAALSAFVVTTPIISFADEPPKSAQDNHPEEDDDKDESKDKKEDEKKDGDEDKDKDEDEEKSKIKPFEDIVTEDAVTREGVFTTHLVDGKVYFEIPEDQFGREFVWQVKVSGIQTGKGTISADSARQYVYFERVGDEVLLRARDYSIVSKEGEPETFVVKKTDLDAILAKMNIKAFRDDDEDDAPLIELTDAFMGKVKGLEGLERGKMDDKATVIREVKAFETNIEARVLGKFEVKPAPLRPGQPKPPGPAPEPEDITAEIRHSILALPKDLMKPRHYNHRVGFFDARYQDYTGKKNKVEETRYIKRWRLEKKNPKAALSEPVEPIVWYIDRGTPTRYIEATREGIEFWEEAFEQAGFKNAIIAKMAPTVEEDPDWDPEDARYAVIRWVPSDIPNAQGPHVADPRTGEIIEADVRMYHNVIKLVEEWYFAQAGATDPRASKLPLPDDVMSDLVRFVVAHEVGHSIGLHHNFIGSNAYTVEQLRDPEFVAKNGVASSIMDYARFNYVMQPEDGVSPIDTVPGPYDKFAIEWGYTEFPGDKSAEEEVEYLNEIADRQLENPAFRWDSYSDAARWDPRIQTEDLTNDAMEATRLGMLNLSRIMDNLVDAATYEPGQSYDELGVAYRALANQYSREIGHVTKYVGGAIYRRELAQGQNQTDVYESYPLTKQQEALDFVKENALKLPEFWRNEEVLQRIGYETYLDTVTRFGDRTLNGLMAPDRIAHIIEAQAGGLEMYDPVELFSEVRTALFEEAGQRGTDVTAYRRHLQSSFVNMMIKSLEPAKKDADKTAVTEDYQALARASLVALQRDLRSPSRTNNLKGLHFANLAAKIDKALDTD
ncbi:zinc-dependent metalloprotease [Hellea sp.]|nr:zinc-dependent metalloprotease [Hellea sp.]